MRSLTIADLPLPDRALCGNGRAARRERTALVRAQRDAARLAAAKDLGTFLPGVDEPYFPSGRVAIRCTVRRVDWWSARPLDDDNLIRGLKPTLDGLADAGVVANDRQFYWDGPVRWEVAQPGEHGITLTLTAEE
jgi:hypothetical protein